MVTGVTQLVFASTEEVNSGGCDNEGDAHGAAGGGGDNNGVTTGVAENVDGVAVVDESGGAKRIFFLGA